MSEKIRLKGQLKLPVVGKNPTFAQMKFVKVALSEPDILPDSGSIFTCDEQGNYDFEIYTGKHLLSYNVGNAWSKPIEIIAEPLAEGLESIEISDLIGFQEIPELDATIAALNQQKQELLLIQQDVVLKQEDAAASAAAAAEDAAKLADVTPESIDAVSNVTYKTIFKPDGGFLYLAGQTHLRIETPTFLAASYTIMLRFSSWSEVAGDLLLSFMPYLSVNEYRGVSAVKMGGVDFDVDFCIDNANSKAFIVISRTDGNTFKETDVIMITATSAVDINSANGWVMTSHDANPASADQIITSLTTNHVTSDTVRSMTYDGVTSKNIRRINAKDAGIPDHVFNAALAQQEAQDFFESEKSKAVLIMNDHMLGTGEEEITDLQMMDVKAYIQSIDPSKGFKVGIARAKVPRPSIFSRYD